MKNAVINENNTNNTSVTIRELPVLPAENLILFPHMVVPWIVDDPNHVKLIDDSLASDRTFAIVMTEKDPVTNTWSLARTGTIGLILRMTKTDEGHAKLMIQGVTRALVREVTQERPYIKARMEPVEDMAQTDMETLALAANVKQVFSRMMELSPNMPSELAGLISSIDSPGALADIAISHLNIPKEERQGILDAVDVRKRLREALKILTHQVEILELGHKIQSRVKDQVDKSQREFFLREQLKAIREELGESGGEAPELAELEQKLRDRNLPDEARDEGMREIERLARMHPSSSEYTVARTYIDWIIDLPWNEETKDRLDLDYARTILDADHYDLDKVKKRIIEYLAVRKLNPSHKGPILCFTGPPGTGKTSLGKSIAKALGRAFHRISLGGVRDEAEIRGHRRTYVGALPGRFIQGLRKTKVKNPVFLLDEIDKIGTDFRGDPSSALLEVLDPEQNSTFMDHYLGVPFDLSKAIFITTANVLDTIPPPLLDRMEVIELSGYTLEEKYEIARRHIIPRQLEAHGLTASRLRFSKAAIIRIAEAYTRESGVRNLEREIAAVCRGVARKIAQDEVKGVSVGVKSLSEYLGRPRFTHDLAERTRIPGVSTGLAWTPTGGDILFIEATRVAGKGGLILTGKLGDVMRESAQAALSLVKSKAGDLGIRADMFADQDVHIHVPAGAVPKDGPSAGIAIACAIVSLFTDHPINPHVAMTGEVTLRGSILPVGGIREKVLAARRAGIRDVILPRKNLADLDDIPENIKKEISFHGVSRFDEVIGLLFEEKKGRRGEHVSPSTE